MKQEHCDSKISPTLFSGERYHTEPTNISKTFCRERSSHHLPCDSEIKSYPMVGNINPKVDWTWLANLTISPPRKKRNGIGFVQSEKQALTGSAILLLALLLLVVRPLNTSRVALSGCALHCVMKLGWSTGPKLHSCRFGRKLTPKLLRHLHWCPSITRACFAVLLQAEMAQLGSLRSSKATRRACHAAPVCCILAISTEGFAMPRAISRHCHALWATASPESKSWPPDFVVW